MSEEPRIEVVGGHGGVASPEEAAAAIAAVEAFRVDTALPAPSAAAASEVAGTWLRAARREAVERERDRRAAWGA